MQNQQEDSLLERLREVARVKPVVGTFHVQLAAGTGATEYARGSVNRGARHG